jgi:hypothetical protein
MAQVKELIQQHLGSGPILKALIQKRGCIPSIACHLPGDPRRVGPTPGEAVAGRVAGLLQGLGALSRREQCAAAESVRCTLFPQDAATAWHDDQLGATVEAIWTCGPGAWQGVVTAPWLAGVGVRVDQLHDDTPAFKVLGRDEVEDKPADSAATAADSPPTQPAVARLPGRLGPGPRTDHRPALNQVKGGLAGSADGGVPLLWAAPDGNRADVSPEVESWLQVKELVGRSDCLCVGDGTLAPPDHRRASMQHQGRLLAPLPGDAGRQRQVEDGVLTHTGADLLPWREPSGKARW